MNIWKNFWFLKKWNIWVAPPCGDIWKSYFLNGIGQLSSRFTFSRSYFRLRTVFDRLCSKPMFIQVYNLWWPIPMIKNIVQKWTWIVDNIPTNHNPRLILKFFIQSVNVKRFFICNTTRYENNNVLALKENSSYPIITSQHISYNLYKYLNT